MLVDMGLPPVVGSYLWAILRIWNEHCQSSFPERLETWCYILYSRSNSLQLMEEWDPAINDFVLRCNSCWRTNNDKQTKIIRTSREKYYCEECLGMFDNLCHC